MTKVTCILHIYNEEYLLPFWLRHHKNIFDDCIIIDYHSTDRSLDICKEICPEWKIITTKNLFFGAMALDREIEDIEKTVDDFKIVLTITEFLVLHRPIKDILEEYKNKKIAFKMNIFSPYSLINYEPVSLNELWKNLLNHDIRFQEDRLNRIMHNHKQGHYKIGRHGSYHKTIDTNDMCLVWFGFYPMNELLLQRKLQIKNKIPESDKNAGFGWHHFWDKNKILEANIDKVNNGKLLQEINMDLYKYIIHYNSSS